MRQFKGSQLLLEGSEESSIGGRLSLVIITKRGLVDPLVDNINSVFIEDSGATLGVLASTVGPITPAVMASTVAKSFASVAGLLDAVMIKRFRTGGRNAVRFTTVKAETLSGFAHRRLGLVGSVEGGPLRWSSDPGVLVTRSSEASISIEH